MFRVSFNDGWEFRPKVSSFAELGGASLPYRPVTLPHDAMLGQERIAPDGAGLKDGGADAYFPGGAFEYRKVFSVPEEYRGSRILLEFEGVYRDAMVYINDDYAGQRPYGYSLFRVDAGRFLRFDRDNEIRVEARAHQDSRWYTGAGIYRDTWLLTSGPVRIGPDGVRVATPDIDGERAVVEVATRVENDSIAIKTVGIITEILDAAGTVVAADTGQISVLPGEPATARQRLYVRAPRLWSIESPALRAARVRLTDGDGEADAETVTFGIRSLRLDPEHGLRINGETVKLRGACVHHDNGVLGAATFARSEERRVQILRDAGFNAIRMSHHPMSKAMLDACDRLGVLVMDEAFDMWTSAKSDFDYSLNFPQWWERDIEAMVAKDVNHPSVILYSIGNEIPETGTPAGAAWGRKLAEKVRALDDTRYVTNAINGMLAVLDDLAAMRSQPSENAGINALMADPADMMNAISSSDLVTRRTAESFSVLDVAGINYAEARYGLDRGLFPNRIIVGSETFPTRIDRNWLLVKQHGNVIGDFTWTGWDYLGEAGIGRPQYATADGSRPTFTAPYPWLLAGCGDIDITGHRRPASYYRQIVFGLRAQPYLAVQRPERHGQTFTGTPWAWSDSIASWTPRQGG
jgi:beta-galactosidase